MIDDDLRERVIQLLRHVPRAPEQPAPGGASQAELDDLVSRLGVPLPDELAGWLRVCKGEAIGPGGVFGARPDDENHDIAAYLAMHPSWRDVSGAGGDGKGHEAWLPVAGDGCGNYYVLVTAGPLVGFVAFVDSMTDPDRLDYVVASNLWQFLFFLLIRELGERAWPFEARRVLAEDPNLASAPAELLAWNSPDRTAGRASG